MAWVIGSTKLYNVMFKTLHWRLLFSHVGVMVGILGTSTVAIYEFFSYSLYQKLDRQLVILADAAVHALPAVKANRAVIHSEPQRIADNDGDLDIPWQDLREVRQSIEWFNADHQLLGKAGKHFPSLPLMAEDFHILQQNKIRTLTIPVYPPKSAKNPPGTNNKIRCDGYIRVSESTENIEEELNRLVWGLGWGGLIALTLGGVGSWWLTRQSLQPIERGFQRLQQFTADASHELRSPITVVKTSIEVIQSHPERIHAADVKKLAAIASATNQMTHLVEDLLLLARTDADPTLSAVKLIPIGIDEILEDLIDWLSPTAQAKGITFKCYLPNGVFVKADVAQLKRLFSNLLENALQYTLPKGTVTVSIFRLDWFVVTRVEDTGIGIAPECTQLVFDRFWRADQARTACGGASLTHREKGSGLGLAIAQAIAQRHGGEISVTSQVGIGSCFEVRLPVVF